MPKSKEYDKIFTKKTNIEAEKLRERLKRLLQSKGHHVENPNTSSKTSTSNGHKNFAEEKKKVKPTPLNKKKSNESQQKANQTQNAQKRSANEGIGSSNNKKSKILVTDSIEDEESSDDDYYYDEEEEEEEEIYEEDYDDDIFLYDSDSTQDSRFSSESGLQNGFVEDLIIHRGTANIRPLSTNADVFDSDDDETQIVELSQKVIKSVHQPQAYAKEELLQLNVKNIVLDKPIPEDAAICEKEVSSSDSDCPQLVPIGDDVDEYYETDEDGMATEYDESSDDYAEYVKTKYFPNKIEGAAAKPVTSYIVNAVNLDYDKDYYGDIFDKNKPTVPAEEDSEPKPWENWSVESDSCIIDVDSVLHEKQPDAQCTSENLQKSDISDGPIFRTFMFNAIDCNNVLVLLKDPIYLYGTVKLTLLAGAVEIYGYSPNTNEEFEVFSPRGCCAVGVTSMPNNCTTIEDIKGVLEKVEKHFILAELRKILEYYEPKTDALLLLKKNSDRKKLVLNLKKYMSENIFPSISVLQSSTSERPHYASESLLHCMINTSSRGNGARALELPNAWRQLPLLNKSRTLIAGGKGVGKSTLLRTLINRELQLQPRLLLIDLDIGQPELFVPQTISCTVIKKALLGPGFFLNCQPDKAYVVGQSNIMICPHIYMRAVKQLLLHCRTQDDYANLPWLINTMGYNKGFGLELLSVICDFLQPTDVIQVESSKAINNFDKLLYPDILSSTPRCIYPEQEFKAGTESLALKYKLHLVEAAVLQESRYQREWEMSAKDMRYTMILARLSDALHGNAEWLSDSNPLCVSLDSIKVFNMAGLCMTEFCLREDLLQIIDANLVYLCRWQIDAPIECFGIGVVRAVDRHLGQIYVLPAMPHDRITPVDCLIIGEIPLPTSLLTNQGPKVQQTAPFVFDTISANASKSIKQIYHRPPEFLTGKHKDIA